MQTPPDWKVILPIMAPTSTIYPLTVTFGDFTIPHMDFMLAGITIQGSVVASRAVQNTMLDFATQHEIKPVIMEFPLNEEGITKAFDTLRDGKMRYRGVLIPQEA
jgi:D-arabinose 1-dehydrogenase-like Zn-dependent alcohol dehydrogenase